MVDPISLQVDRSWLTGRVAFEYASEGQVSLPDFSGFVDALCGSVLVPKGPRPELLNKKGIDVAPGDGRAPRSVLFEYAAVVGSAEDTGSPDRRLHGDAEEEYAFSVMLETEFESFEGSRSIRHRIIERRFGKFGSALPLEALGRAFPVVPDRLFVGFERFEPRWISSLFGLAPVANLRAQCEVTGGRWVFRMSGEDLARGKGCPAEGFEEARTLGALLAGLGALDPFKELCSRWKSA